MLSELLKTLSRPREAAALLKLRMESGSRRELPPLDDSALLLSDNDFCFLVLDKVSRSFAAVIRQLPEALRKPICIYYLVLRALDTIEDDMEFDQEEKLDLLRSFHQVHEDRSWSLEGVGDHDDYRFLLAHYYKVISAFQDLDARYQEVIMDMCRGMANGMAEFTERSVKTVEDYDRYCHYVAGLVGIGLSSLFSLSGLEDNDLKDWKEKSNSMGLFLQKTNIIRDLHEDYYSDRAFWPEGIWGKYVDDLADLIAAPSDENSKACLNAMVTNALTHVPDCLEYLEKLNNPAVFRFCAIPQVMAIATLEAVYNNPEVFRGVVKIRKGQAANLILSTNHIVDVYSTFLTFAERIYSKVDSDSSHSTLTLRVLSEIMNKCDRGMKGNEISKSPVFPKDPVENTLN